MTAEAAVEARHPVGPGSQLAGCLWTAQQKHSHQGKCRLVETELLVEHLAVARRRAAVRGIDEADESCFLERRERPLHQSAVVADHRVAVRGLVAGRHKRVEAEWVLLGRRQLLFDEAADHPSLFQAQAHGPILGSLPLWTELPGALNRSEH